LRQRNWRAHIALSGSVLPGSEVAVMLGELIDQLDDPETVTAVVATLAPQVRADLTRRANDLSMSLEAFVAGAVREFVESANDDLWFQLMTVMRSSEDPGLAAVQTILRWVITPQQT
jgi:hypothetical protein